MVSSTLTDLDYWQLRKDVATIIPRQSVLSGDGRADQVRLKEKGRKSNYHQFNVQTGEMVKLERLLSTEGLNSFVEVSLRAQSCPMPLNLDLYDGLKCPYACKYCFADYFRHSLYTGFFDNSKTMGLRHGDPERYKQELAPLLAHRGEPVSGENDIVNAFRLGIPLRFGIRFEDFTAQEKRIGLSLSVLEYLSAAGYPVMINTKSDLPAEGPYLRALADNKGKSAIHFTLISGDESFLKRMEPGAPTFARRLAAAKLLTAAGVRVVARIEPWMVFLNDSKDMVDDYIGQIKDAGIRHLTLDSYSYSAKGKGLAENFKKMGMDFDRMFLLSSDSQGLSSLLLGKFMEYFRGQGLQASTFDQGNVPGNEDWICCSVGDWFEGFNWGSGVIAVKFIKEAAGKVVRWSDFDRFVVAKGGWLSSKLRHEVHLLWNGEGDAAWHLSWAAGMIPSGYDQDGIMWRWDSQDDFRLTTYNNLKKEI